MLVDVESVRTLQAVKSNIPTPVVRHGIRISYAYGRNYKRRKIYDESVDITNYEAIIQRK